MIEFEDFAKLDLRIGEILSVENNKTQIDCGDKKLSTSIPIKKEKGEKITVGILGDKLLILAASTKEGSPESCPPRAKKTVSLISPDQDIAPGSIVG